MLRNKKGDMTPFDMGRKPKKQNPLLLPLIWGGSWLMTRKFRLRIERRNMKGLKPPYLVLSTHQGFSDYYIAPLALFPRRAAYVSDMEGFAAFGEWLYRGIGCIGKRRYVPDVTVVRNIRHALFQQHVPVVVFPESRHSNVGTTSCIPDNMGKLVKMLGVPLVILSVHGSYLANPFWDESHTRKTRMEAVLECVYTAQEVAALGEEEIQETVRQRLSYDEYRWQREQGIKITYSRRAEGLHKALYQCIACGREGGMLSQGSELSCGICGAVWEMDVYGCLRSKASGDGQIHIPDWYEWQRRQAQRECGENGGICQDFAVRVEALPSQRGFVDMGEGKLFLNAAGFSLEYAGEELFFPHKTRESVQTEYDYRGRGQCIVLSTRDCCYYIYSEDASFLPTKLQFISEYLKEAQDGKIIAESLSERTKRSGSDISEKGRD
ncbi:MAG: 1-acyl-sn-glycerol-3-phosphate acyltransferase [Lachnospiraceae bacterium]|nr:1-acyl-sn-glycerol-3-phosphate acyltransferase [Lachnospiraceae bacterium]